MVSVGGQQDWENGYCQPVVSVHGTQDPDTNVELAHTLGRNQGQENAVFAQCVTGDITHTLKAEGFDASEDGTGRGQPIVPVAFSSKDCGGDATENMSPTLRAGGHAGSHANAGAPPAVAYGIRTANTSSNGWGIQEEVTHTLDTAQGVAVPHNMAVRRLTPVECERLQGFPDGHTDVPYRGKPASDGPRYKAIGNSMAVPVMRWIGERIQKLLESI